MRSTTSTAAFLSWLLLLLFSTITSVTVAQDEDDCIDDLNKIWYAEGMEFRSDLEALQAQGKLDESVVMIEPEDVVKPREYILCPNTEFITGTFYYDEQTNLTEYLGGTAPLGGRSNMHVKCGADGSSSNNCTIHTGEFGFSLRYFEFLDFEYAQGGIVTNLTVEGVTFGKAPASQFSYLDTPVVISNYTGDLTFKDCVFQHQRHPGEIILIPDVDFNFGCVNGDSKLESTFEDCTFNNFESVSQGSGNPAAAFIVYGLCPNQQTNVINCRFQDNNYARDSGTIKYAGMVGGDGGFRIEGSCFTNNQVIGGGPVTIYQSTQVNSVELENNYEFNNSIVIRNRPPDSGSCSFATLFDPTQFSPSGFLLDEPNATCFDAERTTGCIMDTDPPTTGPTATPTAPQPTAAPTTAMPSVSLQPSSVPVDMKQCLIGLSLVDRDFDNYLDQSEYVNFLNRQTANAWLNANFSDLPDYLQSNFVNKTVGDGGPQGLLIDIVGSKPWQPSVERGSAQDLFLGEFCKDTFGKIDIAMAPPTMAPTETPPCIANMSDIYMAERTLRPSETSLQQRLYVLCPNTVFETGMLDVRGPEPYVTVIGGSGSSQHPILPRANMTIQCGSDGKRSNNCTVTGMEGLLGVNDLFAQLGNATTAPELIDYDITGFHLKGVTFDKMLIGAFQIRGLLGTDILIEDVAFTNNEIPLFMSLTGVPEFDPEEGPGGPPGGGGGPPGPGGPPGGGGSEPARGNIFGPEGRRLRGLQQNFDGDTPFGAPLDITFKDCLFENNRNLRQSGDMEEQFSTHEFNQMIWGGTVTTTARFESTIFKDNNYSQPILLAIPANQVITDMSHLMFGAFALDIKDCCFIDNLSFEKAALIQTVAAGIVGTFSNNYLRAPDADNTEKCHFVGQVTENRTNECIEADRTDKCDLLPEETLAPTVFSTSAPTVTFTLPPTSTPSARPVDASAACSVASYMTSTISVLLLSTFWLWVQSS